MKLKPRKCVKEATVRKKSGHSTSAIKSTKLSTPVKKVSSVKRNDNLSQTKRKTDDKPNSASKRSESKSPDRKKIKITPSNSQSSGKSSPVVSLQRLSPRKLTPFRDELAKLKKIRGTVKLKSLQVSLPDDRNSVTSGNVKNLNSTLTSPRMISHDTGRKLSRSSSANSSTDCEVRESKSHTKLSALKAQKVASRSSSANSTKFEVRQSRSRSKLSAPKAQKMASRSSSTSSTKGDVRQSRSCSKLSAPKTRKIALRSSSTISTNSKVRQSWSRSKQSAPKAQKMTSRSSSTNSTKCEVRQSRSRSKLSALKAQKMASSSPSTSSTGTSSRNNVKVCSSSKKLLARKMALRNIVSSSKGVLRSSPRFTTTHTNLSRKGTPKQKSEEIHSSSSEDSSSESPRDNTKISAKVTKMVKSDQLKKVSRSTTSEDSESSSESAIEVSEDSSVESLPSTEMQMQLTKSSEQNTTGKSMVGVKVGMYQSEQRHTEKSREQRNMNGREDDKSRMDTPKVVSVKVTHPMDGIITNMSCSECRKNTGKLQNIIGGINQQMTTALSKKDKEIDYLKKMLSSQANKIKRLETDLKWKDDQLQDMNEIASKNVELEAKLNHLMTDEQEYHNEVKRQEDKKNNAMEKKVDEEYDNEEVSAPKKPKKKKEKQDEDEDINELDELDALFVSEDSDIEVVSTASVMDDVQQALSRTSSIEEIDQIDTQLHCITEISIPTQENNIKLPDEDTPDDENKKHGRKEIRKLFTSKKLQEETIKAAREEKERRDRMEKEHEKHMIVTEVDSQTKLPVCTQLVLASDPSTMKPVVEVNKKLLKNLKPHQWQAVEFLWDNTIESLECLQSNPGNGCILAHCMGLGKTLSVITFLHTLFTSTPVELNTCLVVCPLNTVLNWEYEWRKWLNKADRLKVYEMASCTEKSERAALLCKWQRTGGIMIIGYQLFRILTNYKGRSKRNKLAYTEGLLHPGPDIVVCDEGHMLKNSNSAVFQAMKKIRTSRRIILTGTPLQNNLVEYHCMVSFVKPNLLGSLREFNNRFVNPITNGQHSDSTAADVKLMKRRAHVLHEMLRGCVQRRDYSVLTALLPPRYEYVLSIRLTPLQIDLYKKYISEVCSKNSLSTDTEPALCTATLFADYQALMRIWSHPWLLKMDEDRQIKKKVKDMLTGTRRGKALQFRDDELDETDEEMFLSDDDSDLMELDDEEEVEGKDDDNDAEYFNSDSEGDGTDLHKLSVRLLKTNAATVMRRSRSTEQDSDTPNLKNKKSGTNAAEVQPERKAKILAGEVIRKWKSMSRGGGTAPLEIEDYRVDQKQPWWASSLNEEDHKQDISISGKMVLLTQVLNMAETLGDKVIVFSQSILTLDLIEMLLKHQDEEAMASEDPKASFWKKDRDYVRIDGSTSAQTRAKHVETFNNPSNKRVRLFLISTKAGGLGVNLEAANRVVLFDVSWNPSHDIQSIFRVYRFGQQKPVYIYRLVAQGTMEEKIYERQVTKETLAQRVIDEHQLDRHFSSDDLRELYKFDPDTKPQRSTPVVPKDIVLAELLTVYPDIIVAYHEHDSLLQQRPEEDLDEDERKAAWDEYEREKQGLVAKYLPSRGLVPQKPRVQDVGVDRDSRQSAIIANYTNLATTIPTHQNARSHLPRVVQEILKYNPNIGPDELERRLRAFLGMQSRHIPRPKLNQQPIASGDTDTSALKSRLPLPGRVPASYMNSKQS